MPRSLCSLTMTNLEQILRFFVRDSAILTQISQNLNIFTKFTLFDTTKMP
ncbi:hypothetical protein ACWIUD_03530 [Helicobacter sp. 23-1044]